MTPRDRLDDSQEIASGSDESSLKYLYDLLPDRSEPAPPFCFSPAIILTF